MMHTDGARDDRGTRAPVICATAARNGLADTPYKTWAFRRAELTAHAESPFRCWNGKAAIMTHVRSLSPQSYGWDRIDAIAANLFSQVDGMLSAVAPFGPVGVLLSIGARPRVGDGDLGGSTRRAKLAEKIRAQLASRDVIDTDVRVNQGSHGSFAELLETGIHLLRARAVSVVVAGAIDTYYDPDSVDELLDQSRLFDGRNLDSIIPGEGGALVVLVERSIAAQARLQGLARIEALASKQEPSTIGNDVPLLGLALSRAALLASKRLEREPRPLDLWVSDMSNEAFRTREFQLAYPRVSARVARDHSRVEFLPPALGDLGAATMPMGIVLGIESMRRGDPAGSTCLVTGSSPDGARGAVLVTLGGA